MPLLKFTILLLVCSCLFGCPDGPKIPVCISSGNQNQGCDGVDVNGNKMHKDFSETKNWFMTPPESARTLFEYCEINKGKNGG